MGVNENKAPKSSIKIIITVLLFLSLGLNAYLVLQPVLSNLAHQKKFDSSKEKLSKKANPRPENGLWALPKFGTGNAPDDQLKEKMKQLETLGYLAGVEEPSQLQGVIHHIKEKAQPGYNLFTSGHGNEAVLMDMAGKIVHTWSKPYLEIWPDNVELAKAWNSQYFRRCYLLPRGELLAIVTGSGLIKLDKDSSLIWKYDVPAHHDLDVDKSGNIYVLTRQAHMLPEYNKKEPILEDFIAVVSPEGKLIKRISILTCLKNSPYWPVLDKKKMAGDITHANTVVWLDGSLAKKSPVFKKGNILISLAVPSFVGIVDMEKEAFIWGESTLFREQHQPEPMPDGTIVLFDNKGLGEQSQIVRFDPVTTKVTWQFAGKGNSEFFSYHMGAVQPLPNGNILVSHTSSGRAFEVTPAKEIVWDFISPFRAGMDDKWVAQLPEMLRIDQKTVENWLGR